MSKIAKTNNQACRAFVRNCVAFDNSNKQLYARRNAYNLYVVYSYGPHWPLFIYCPETEQWFENEDNYSPTTSRHHSYAHPHFPTIKRPASWMREAAERGFAFIALSQCEADAA